MRARTPALAGAAVAVLVSAGCASASGVRVGPPDTAGPRPPVCGDVVVTPGGAGTQEECLSVGSTLRIRLEPGDPVPVEKGDALRALSKGVYRGAKGGSAEVSGFRRACPSAGPGGPSCHAVVRWRVTVDVR
jgi:hypothetical protein